MVQIPGPCKNTIIWNMVKIMYRPNWSNPHAHSLSFSLSFDVAKMGGGEGDHYIFFIYPPLFIYLFIFGTIF